MAGNHSPSHMRKMAQAAKDKHPGYHRRAAQASVAARRAKRDAKKAVAQRAVESADVVL